MNYLTAADALEEISGAVKANNAVLYCRRGLSYSAGYPSYAELTRALVDWARKYDLVTRDFADDAAKAIDHKAHLSSIVDYIDLRVQDRQLLAREFVSRRYPQASQSDLPAIHKLVARIPWSALISVTYDNLLETAFAGLQVLGPNESDEISTNLVSARTFILRLLGSAESGEGIILGATRFDQMTQRYPRLLEALRWIFHNRTVVFLGSSIESVEFMLSRFSTLSTSSTHIAILNQRSEAFEVRASQLAAKFPIKIVRVEYSANKNPARDMLAGIVAMTRVKKDTEPHAVPLSPPKVKSLRLVNVGPFEDEEFQFSSDLNVMIGDNGVGKSTVLKALAFVLSGGEPREVAAGLVRSGESVGKIEVTVTRAGQVALSDNTYAVEIDCRGTKTEVRLEPSRPIDSESWLALGFPALRTITGNRSRGPEIETKRIGPNSSDLAPLLYGGSDPRMDSLRQWLVNLDYQRASASEARKNEIDSARDRVFSLITELAPEYRMEQPIVMPSDFKILIGTPDGKVPLEQLSQGLLSLLGWVGVVAQRLYEARDVSVTETENAIVLVDEIDAHLHPNWQRKILWALRKIFPGIQFLVTTHSPLVVAGLSSDHLIRLARVSGRVARLELENDVAYGRVDQILLTTLFGLRSVVDPETEGMLERYRHLGGRERNAEEEKDYNELEATLFQRIPPTAENYAERKKIQQDHVASFESISRMLMNVVPEVSAHLANQAKALMGKGQAEEES